ncbi:peptide deformylase [Paenibacillus senegalensis]|uniref:peptide deformylase n=1 Tax=Paenibacillus senegalensis TaxID=1465766 RepID=UPI0002894B0D|nr:peptide deformylase [Paenibacillus senegalensis]
MNAKMIVPFGDPVLRKKSRPVEAVTGKVLGWLDQLGSTLYAEEGRAGLAAPQIGVLRRIFVMDCGDGLTEWINPVITEASGQQEGPEACLSYPGYAGIVRRAQKITVETLNRQGEKVTLEAEGYTARCIQHEIDHLDGILYIDRIVDDQFYNERTGKKADLLHVLRIANG